MTKLARRDVLQQSAISFIGTAAFPRVAYRLRWPTRLGPRGFIAYATLNTLLLFAIRTWVIPYFKRIAEERERAEHELREQLGRDPTEDELLAHLGITCERWRPERAPSARIPAHQGAGGEAARARRRAPPPPPGG